MKNRKRIILVLIILSVSVFSTGCMNKIKEKVGGKITEKVIEKATDGKVTIDKKDGVSIEVEGGSMKTGENLEWPKDSMESLPKPKGTVVSITELKEEDSTSVIFGFDKEKGGDDYLQELLDLGYVQRSINKSEEFVIFTGYKDDNSLVMLSYQPKDEYGSITILRNNDSVKEYFESEKNAVENEEPPEINMEESMEWPKDSMDKIPPIKAQITSVTKNVDYVSLGFKGIGKKDIISYIEKIKSLGFDENQTEAEQDDYFSYAASNNKEHSISITWSSNEGNIYYMKQ